LHSGQAREGLVILALSIVELQWWHTTHIYI